MYFSSSFIACVLSVLITCAASQCTAQTFTNPGFESGNTGWTCLMEVNSASVYGGSGSSMVAEVDGHNNPSSTADDRLLCQTLTGFTIGSIYTLEFDATRRASAGTPTSVSVSVRMADELVGTVTRTGGWNMVREYISFTATATSLALRISPNFTPSLGMLFDNFSISEVSPLPVTLVRFDAWPSGGAVDLEWVTATEQNSAVFVVQRSVDTEIWEAVVELPAAGNSQSMITYRTVDPEPLPGISYYRLKQMDLDGTVDLSEVMPVRFSSTDSGLVVWPSPATDRVNIRLDEPHGAVEVYNSMGQRMQLRFVRMENVIGFDIASLPTGSYHIRTLGPMVGTGRFIKD